MWSLPPPPPRRCRHKLSSELGQVRLLATARARQLEEAQQQAQCEAREQRHALQRLQVEHARALLRVAALEEEAERCAGQLREAVAEVAGKEAGWEKERDERRAVEEEAMRLRGEVRLGGWVHTLLAGGGAGQGQDEAPLCCRCWWGCRGHGSAWGAGLMTLMTHAVVSLLQS